MSKYIDDNHRCDYCGVKLDKHNWRPTELCCLACSHMEEALELTGNHNHYKNSGYSDDETGETTTYSYITIDDMVCLIDRIILNKHERT